MTSDWIIKILPASALKQLNEVYFSLYVYVIKY